MKSGTKEMRKLLTTIRPITVIMTKTIRTTTTATIMKSETTPARPLITCKENVLRVEIYLPQTSELLPKVEGEPICLWQLQT